MSDKKKVSKVDIGVATFDLECIQGSVKKILDGTSVPIEEFLKNHKNLKKTAGVYVFWWTGDDARFRESVKNGYELKGPHNFSNKEQELIKVKIDNAWINHETHKGRICIYVGKTTRLHTRINDHVKLNSKDIWAKRGEKKLQPNTRITFRKKPNTVSQFRIGIERLFKDNAVELIKNHTQVSYLELSGNKNAINRFFIEDKLIGELYPLFNMDIER